MATPSKQNLSSSQSRILTPPGLTSSGNRPSNDRGVYRNVPLVPPGLPPLGKSSNSHQEPIVPGKSPPHQAAPSPHTPILIPAQWTTAQTTSLRSQDEPSMEPEENWQQKRRTNRDGQNHRIYFQSLRMAVNAVKERSEQDGRDMRTIMDEAMRKIENRQQDTRNVIDEIMRNLDENLRRMDSGLEPEEYKVTTSSPSTWTQGTTPVTENRHGDYERRNTLRERNREASSGHLQILIERI